MAVWFTGGCCAPVTVCARPFRVDRVGGGATARSLVMAVVFALSFIGIQLIAQPRVGGLPAWGINLEGVKTERD